MFPSLWALETQSVKRAANLKTTRLSFKSTRGLSEALYESQEWIMYLSPRCLLSSLEDLRRLDGHKILLAKSRRLQIFCQKSSNDTFWQYYWCFIGLFSDFLVIQSHFCTTILGGSIEFDMFQLMRSVKTQSLKRASNFMTTRMSFEFTRVILKRFFESQSTTNIVRFDVFWALKSSYFYSKDVWNDSPNWEEFKSWIKYTSAMRLRRILRNCSQH